MLWNKQIPRTVHLIREKTEAQGAGRRFARIVPLAFVTYSLAYLDRVNYGFGAAAGLAETLGVTESVSALISAVFLLATSCFKFREPRLRPSAAPNVSSSGRCCSGAFFRRSPASFDPFPCCYSTGFF